MTEQAMRVEKLGRAIPMSCEQIAARAEDRAVYEGWLGSIADDHAPWRAQVAAARAAERAAAAPVELTVDTLLAKLRWSREYATHAVQTYCQCEDDIDGWTRCPHAHDLGLELNG